MRLADLLAENGDLDELRARTDTGDPAAAEGLANLLAEQATWTRPCRFCALRPNVGDWNAPVQLTGPLADLSD